MSRADLAERIDTVEHRIGLDRRSSGRVILIVEYRRFCDRIARPAMQFLSPFARRWRPWAGPAERDGTGRDLRSEMGTLGADLRSEMRTLGADLRSEMQTLGADLRSEMQTLGADLRSEMQALGASLRGEIEAQGVRLRGEIEAQGVSLRGEIAELRGEVTALRGEVTDLRDEMHTLHGITVRRFETALAEGLEETRRFMTILHEDTLSRIALLREGWRPS